MIHIAGKQSDFLYITDIVRALGQDVVLEGNPDNVKIDKVTALHNANETSLIWINPRSINKPGIISSTRAKAIICDKSIAVDERTLQNKCLIKVSEPKLAIINIIDKFFKQKYETFIHKSATISNNARIADDVYVGANVYIGDAEIGKGVIIEGNCFIYDNTVIRDNSIIQAGVVIGSEGFSFFKTGKKELLRFPQLGSVILDSDTHIGSNTVINRGTLGETYVGRGSKINKLCIISHNVIIGTNNFIASSVCINGSVIIGDNNYIGTGANIRNKINIGNDTVIGMGAVVVKSVPDNIMVYGVPAKEVNRLPNKSLF